MSTESAVHAVTGPRGGGRAIAAVVAAVIVGVAVSAMSSGGHGKPASGRAPSGPALRQYSDQAGWTLRYPAVWHLERSEQFRGLAVIEVTLATFAPRPGIEQHVSPGSGNVRVVPPLARNRRFPADGVALRLESQTGGPAGPFAARATRLPVTARSFTPSVRVAGVSYNAATGETFGGSFGAPRSHVRQLVLDGQAWTAVLWIGPSAPTASILALQRIIASVSVSLRPPSRDTGGTAGSS